MKQKIIFILCTLLLISGCSVSRDSNEVIHLDENLSELVVTYPDGLTETITDQAFLSMATDVLNNQLVVDDLFDESRYEVIYSLLINDQSYECLDIIPYNSRYNKAVIKMNGQYYKQESRDNQNIFNLIKLAHSLYNDSMEHFYKEENEVASIDELFSQYKTTLDLPGIVNTAEYSGIYVDGNGTEAIYDLNTDDYHFSFFDMRSMSTNQLTYNWTRRKATLGSCRYDRNEEKYSNCSQYEQDWIQAALHSFLKCHGNYMAEEDFIRLEKEYVIKKNTPDIHFENVNEIIVTTLEGYTDTITEPLFISNLIEALNNGLIEDVQDHEWPLCFTLNINGFMLPLYSYGGGVVAISSFKIADKFYVFRESYHSSGAMLYSINNIFSLINGTNELLYKRSNKIFSINELFSNVLKTQGDYIVDNGDFAGISAISNGTNTLYDFTTKQYQFTFLNKETMTNSVIVYNWINRTAKLDSCEYNRNTDIYTKCSEYQQSWIQEALDAFLVSYGNYMDESDFLAQEDSFVFERK